MGDLRGKLQRNAIKREGRKAQGGHCFIFPFVSLCSVLFRHSPALGISSRCISICISLLEETGHQVDPSSTSRHHTLFSTSRFFPFSTPFYFLLKFSQFCWSFAFVMEDGSLVVCERSLFFFLNKKNTQNGPSTPPVQHFVRVEMLWVFFFFQFYIYIYVTSSRSK